MSYLKVNSSIDAPRDNPKTTSKTTTSKTKTPVPAAARSGRNMIDLQDAIAPGEAAADQTDDIQTIR
jgi:hypothetical protein